MQQPQQDSHRMTAVQKGYAIHDTIRIKHGALTGRHRKAISITAAAAADDDTCDADTASIIWYCDVTGKVTLDLGLWLYGE